METLAVGLDVAKQVCLHPASASSSQLVANADVTVGKLLLDTLRDLLLICRILSAYLHHKVRRKIGIACQLQKAG